MPAWLGDSWPRWHPGWTLAIWQTKGLPAYGRTAAQQLADKLPYNVEQALLYSIDLQP